MNHLLALTLCLMAGCCCLSNAAETVSVTQHNKDVKEGTALLNELKALENDPVNKLGNLKMIFGQTPNPTSSPSAPKPTLFRGESAPPEVSLNHVKLRGSDGARGPQGAPGPDGGNDSGRQTVTDQSPIDFLSLFEILTPRECCLETPSPVTERKTRTITYNCRKSYMETHWKYVCSYEFYRRGRNCRWERRTRVAYKYDVCTKLETYTVSVQPPCPWHQKVCCAGFIGTSRGCISIEHLKVVIELIKLLKQLYG